MIASADQTLTPPPVSHDAEVFAQRDSFDAVLRAMDTHGHLGRIEIDPSEYNDPEECEHEWEFVDDSYGDAFGLVVQVCEYCPLCNSERAIEAQEPDYDE